MLQLLQCLMLQRVGLTAAQTFTVTSSDPNQVSGTVGSYSATYGGYPLTTVTANSATSGKSATLTISIPDPADATGVAKLTTTHTITMGGAVAKEVISFDKTSYSAGEQMIITVTGTDASGNPTYDGAAAPNPLTSNKALGGSSTLNAYSAGKAVTGSFDADGSVINAYTVYAPSTGGQFTITATGTDAAGTTQLTASASVSDAGLDAATDAANEATDAANAATDAALAAADAADAATAAAQDASDAVAALSAEVSKMISSLKAQITALTNLVIKIQKKVKA